MEFGQKLAGYLNKGDIVALSGQVGSGKTVFIKGVCRAFAVPPLEVHSPTFLIMNVYDGSASDQTMTIRHFDFYRLETEKDLTELGLDDWLDDDSIKLIEWSEHVRTHISGRHWAVALETLNDDRRRIDVRLMN